MKVLAIAATILGCSRGGILKDLLHHPKKEYEVMTEADYKFMEHVIEYGKSYGTREEFDFRASIFKENLKLIEEFNSDQTMTYKLGINQFSTWTPEERKKLAGGFKPPRGRDEQTNVLALDVQGLPQAVNWTAKGAVTPVINQGACGSSPYFGATASMEGSHQIKTGNLVTLSVQQIIDCSSSYGNNGCGGGFPEYAFKYAKDHGMMSVKDYPYKAQNHFDECSQNYDKSKVVCTVQKWHDIKKKNVKAFKQALTLGPVALAIEADKSSFQMYKSGVYTDPECGTLINHGVSAVGYGVQDGQEYFLIKNQWTTDWGENGYIKLGANNICGVLEQPSIAFTD